VSEAVLERAIAIESICTDYGVPLAAVALQFSTRDERVASTVVGMSRPQRFAQVADLVDLPIPQQLWRDLEDLVALGQSGVGTTA
jgi:D-threo-aldose 1-dehydrogenase